MRLVLALLASLIAVTPALAQEQPRTVGVLKVAMIGEPPSLDLHTTTAVITQQIMWHVFETLYTFDRQLFYEDVGRIKLGDWFGFQVHGKNLRGVHHTNQQAFFNVWFVK